MILAMELTGISCAGYKVFRDALNLEIRPLTVLVGKNNAGKSALARLPILLAHALASGSREILDVQVGHLEFGSSFLDLIYRRRQHGQLSLGARFKEGAERLELDVTIQNLSHLGHDESVVSREFGIRMTLGVDRSRVGRLVFGESGRLVGLGLVADLEASWFLVGGCSILGQTSPRR